MKDTILKIVAIMMSAYVMRVFLEQGYSPYPFIAALLTMIALEV